MFHSISRRPALLALFATTLAAICNSQWVAAKEPTADTRTLPAVGTTWCYSVGNGRVFPLTLKQVEGGVASYEAGSADALRKIDEQVDTYTTVNASRDGQFRMLAFPLSRGKSWSDEFDEVLTSELGPGMSWQYHYKAASFSEVVGTKRIKVGAGTYDTVVIERSTSWLKSQPSSSDAELRDRQCDKPECSVSGVSKELLWYAPAIGRAVLRVYSQSGHREPTDDHTPDEILKNAKAVVVELVGYGEDATCTSAHAPLLARTPSSPWSGFAMRPNDTWEFLMSSDIARE